jgi:hypothetical protein
LGAFRKKIKKFFDFCVNTPTPFPESGKHFQDSGIFVIDFLHKITLPLPQIGAFWEKIKILFDFRVNTSTSSPESGSGNHFQGSGICVIDFSHKITPPPSIWVLSGKK